MSQVARPESDLRDTLADHREAFKTLTEHDDDEIARLFGEYPLDLLNELTEDEDDE